MTRRMLYSVQKAQVEGVRKRRKKDGVLRDRITTTQT